MFKVITENFLECPKLEMDITEPTDDIILFGKHYRMYKDDWKHHVHLKCTNKCDANCAFCIEQESKTDRENSAAFLDSARAVVSQLKEQSHFKTLSVTGGEPTIFPYLQEVIDLASESNPLLFSINSNGAAMNTAIKENTFNGWFNLSKHSIDDKHIFRRTKNIGAREIREFKKRQPEGKVRLQCVLGMKNGINSVEGCLDFIDIYRGEANDYSFRSLIVDTAHGAVPDIFWEFRKFLFDGKFIVEQTIQDYYVYEIYEYDGVRITLSWSNMYLLQKYNETQTNNFLEEIIVHPDGMVTGSWNKKTLVIHNPYKKENSNERQVE